MTQATVPTTELVHPTEEAAIAALAGQVGKAMARELWTLAVTDLNLSQPINDPFLLRKVAEHLMSIGDGCRVTGRGLRVQVIPYQALAAA
jgi:hypothetical protein